MSAQQSTKHLSTVQRAPHATGRSLALAGVSRPRTYGNACGVASLIASKATRAMGLEATRGMGWTTVHADFPASTTRRLERSLT